MNFNNLNKSTKLAWSIFLDAMGYVSLVIPFFDLIWAPASAYFMTKLYKGQTGKIAAAIVFIEEALPMMDVVPTFTLMWIYTFVFKTAEETAVEVE